MPLFGEKMFLTKEFMFFINILEDLIKERRQSTEVKFNGFGSLIDECKYLFFKLRNSTISSNTPLKPYQTTRRKAEKKRCGIAKKSMKSL